MEVDSLLETEFSLTDEPSAAFALPLATASQRVSMPRPSPAAAGSLEQWLRASQGFQNQLGDAVRIAGELVEPSRYNVQVLVVWMRALVLGRGSAGCADTLALLAKLLGPPWEGLELPPPDNIDKRRRRWARQIDSVFDEIYDHLAREGEAFERLGRAGQAGTPPFSELCAWPSLVAGVDTAIQARDLRVGRWSAVREVLLVRAEHPASTGSGVPQGEGPVAAEGGCLPAGVAAAAEPMSAESELDCAAVEPLRQATDRSGHATLRVSARYEELERRLASFTQLLQGKQFEKASLVARDLQEQLDAFDVAAFFPDLFAGYFEASAQYAEEIALFLDRQPGLRSQSLLRLYQTDLDRFLASEKEPTSR